MSDHSEAEIFAAFWAEVRRRQIEADHRNAEDLERLCRWLSSPPPIVGKRGLSVEYVVIDDPISIEEATS